MCTLRIIRQRGALRVGKESAHVLRHVLGKQLDNETLKAPALTHLLVYVASIPRAEQLARELRTQTDALFVGVVHTEQKPEANEKIMKSFTESPLAVVVNINILSVGITVERVNGVLLTSEGSNEAMVVQRIFRCLTATKGKSVGYVLLPAVVTVERGGGTCMQTFSLVSRALRRLHNEPTNWCTRHASVGTADGASAATHFPLALVDFEERAPRAANGAAEMYAQVRVDETLSTDADSNADSSA